MDVMLSGADAIADTVWLGGREDTQTVFDGMAAIVNESGGLAITFLGPLSLLFGMIGLVIVSAVTGWKPPSSPPPLALRRSPASLAGSCMGRLRRARWRLAERALAAGDAGGLSNSGCGLEFVALL